MTGYPAISVAHDEPLVGDTVFTLTLNYQWRRLVTDLLAPLCFDSYWSGTASQVAQAVDHANALINDIYNSEVIAVSGTIPAFSVSRDTPLIIPPGGADVVCFWEALDVAYGDYDPDGWLVGNDLICPNNMAGWWLVIFECRFAASAWYSRFYTNSAPSQHYQYTQQGSTSMNTMTQSGIVYVQAGDSLRVVFNNVSGVQQALISGTGTPRCASLRAFRLQREAPG